MGSGLPARPGGITATARSASSSPRDGTRIARDSEDHSVVSGVCFQATATLGWLRVPAK